MSVIDITRSKCPAGADFRVARERAGVSILQASRDAACSPQAVQKYETGKTARPSQAIAKNFTRVYKRYLKAAVSE